MSWLVSVGDWGKAQSRELVSLRPTVLVGMLAACQIAAWTMAPALTHSSPPLDVVEGYMWGREWVLATYKHPALPSWVLEATRILTGSVGWPAYLVSQLFVAATFLCVYWLGCDLLKPRRAAAGTLLLTGIGYYTWPTVEFNHNVALMPFWAGLCLASWRAVEARGIAWWVLVGALAAGGLYAKLTIALLLFALMIWMLSDESARQSFRAPGPWIALTVFVVLVAPLTHWLEIHDFAPLKYASTRWLVEQESVLAFFAGVFLNLVGLVFLVAIALARPNARTALEDVVPVSIRAIRYLIVVTIGPLALAVIGAIVTNASLRVAWSSPMFNLAGLLAIALTSSRFDGEALRRIAISAAALLIILPVGYAVVVVAWPLRKNKPLRVTWPQAEISERFVDLWTRETGQPLRIVGGNRWIAGLVGVTAPGLPSILSGPDLGSSPWIVQDRLKREGMLLVWDEKGRWLPQYLWPIIDAAPLRQERFASRGGDIVVRYAIVPPNAN